MIQGDKVTILTGRAKTGKTHEILRHIAENEKNSKKSLLIVPSTLSFEAEKRLARACGGGFMHTTITGFYRLGERVLEENGLKNSFINSQGRVMVIRRAIEEAKEKNELGLFRGAASKPGFALMCDEIFTNFLSCELYPDDIKRAADNLTEGSFLRRKLTDLAVIYRGLFEYLSGTQQVIHAESEAICSCIPKSDMFKVHIYIDGIENPGKQIYEMIAAMLPVAESMTIALPCDTSGSAPNLFAREKEIFDRLRSLIHEAGYVPDEVRLTREKRYSHDVFEHMERHLWTYPPKAFAGDSSPVKLVAASGAGAEVDMLCAAIKGLTEKGVRYRQMAVIAADTAKYDSLIKDRFSQMKIPLFTDCRINLFSTAPAILVRSALACISQGYKTQDLCALIKTGYAGITYEEAEKLENFFITYGIGGSRAHSSVEGTGSFPEAEDLRKKVISPLQKMQEDMRRATVGEKCAALMRYLEKVNLRDAVFASAEKLAKDGFEVAAKQYEQTYDMIEALLYQLDGVMGHMHINHEDFSDIIDEGLTADIIGIIPAVTDAVQYSGVTPSLPDEVKYVFVIGATEEAFPPVRKDNGIIDDTELAKIKAAGNMEVWLSTQSKRIQDAECIYRLISHADKQLYISFPIGGSETQNYPASTVARLQTMFGGKSFISNSDDDCPYRLYTMDSTAKGLRALADEEELSSKDKAYISAYMRDERTKDECERLLSAVFFDPSPKKNLSSEIIDKIYGKRFVSSVSMLETYNKCPFGHFIQYTLHAKPIKAFNENASDDGSFYHEVIERFTNYVLNGEGIDIRTMTDEEEYELIKNAFDKTVSDYRSGLYSKGGMMSAKRNYMLYVLKYAIHAIVNQIRSGDFNILASEEKFGGSGKFGSIAITLDSGRNIELSGKIDRIDVCDTEGAQYLRIVDYKTGGSEISLEKLCAGLQIQLPIYLDAVCKDKYQGGGMYYMQIKGIPTSAKDETDFEKKLAEGYKLKGLTLSTPDVIRASTKSDEIEDSSPIEKAKELIQDTSIYSTMSEEQFEAIRRIAVERAKETAQEILSGAIPVSPYRFDKDHTSCDYCEFRRICMFDENMPSCTYRRVPDPDLDELLDKQ